MTGADDTIFDQAAAWHLAGERDDMDWDGFTTWLEADPRHGAAYDEISLADAAVAYHRGELAPFAAPTEARSARKWPVWASGALAASLAAMLAVPQLIAPATQTFASGAEPLSVALGNGSQAILAPHSHLTVTGRNGGQLVLEGGAYFTVRHDPARALAVRVGDLEVRDVGTHFDLQATQGVVRIAVSQGQVEVRGEALSDPIPLAAGQRMVFDPTNHLAKVARISPQGVGEWRQDRLTYDAEPLSLVAADLARYAGVSISVPPPLAGRRFSGTLSIHDGDSAVRDLAQLMGLDLSGRAGVYRLGERR